MFSFCSPKTVIYYLILISSINRRPHTSLRKRPSIRDIRPSSTSAVHARAIVKCIGLGLERESWSDCSLLNHLATREREEEIDLCIENRDRSRMQTALKRVLRGNGDGRACCASRRQRHIRMSISRHGLCISQSIGTWPITEKRVCLDSGYTSATNWEIACMMEIVSWIRVTGQFLCLRVGDASVMNNFWSVIREFHLFRGHNCHHLVSKFI